MFSIRIEGRLYDADSNISLLNSNDYECQEELFMELCSALSSMEGIEFLIEGFGIDWPVDVETDLSTAIPQIFEGLNLLENEKDFSIELYEQGIEKELHFRVYSEYIEVSCTKLGKTERLSNLEIISKKELLDMLNRFKQQILIAGRLTIKNFDSLYETLD